MHLIAEMNDINEVDKKNDNKKKPINMDLRGEAKACVAAQNAKTN